MGKYITDSYARIICNKCGNKLVDILKPGTAFSFDGINPCPCEGKQVTDYSDKGIDELRELLKAKGIPFSSQAKEETLIKKLKGA